MSINSTQQRPPKGVEYLKKNGIEDFLIRMLMDLGKMRPKDPFNYVMEVLTRKAHSNRKFRTSNSRRKESIATPGACNVVDGVNRNVVSFVREWGRDRLPDTGVPVDEDIKRSQARTQSCFIPSSPRALGSATFENFSPMTKEAGRDDERNIFSWEYDVLSQSNATLVRNCVRILEGLEIPRQFTIPTKALQTFLMSICNNYREKNPYHNFKHAFSVMLGTSLLLRGGSQIFLENIETFAILIAALCHDVGHPGMNNDYFVKAKHTLAYRYNDIAVLENMHASLTFELMRMPKHDICENLSSDDEWRTFRRVAICAILATDMKVHFELTAKLSDFASIEVLEGFRNAEGVEIPDMPEYRELIQKCIVHAADLTNPILSTKLSKEWAKRVVIEFYQQAETEKKEHLPFAPFMDQHPDNMKELAGLQIGFINFVVKPFWSSWAQIFPIIKPQYDQLLSNLDYWANMKAKLEEAETNDIKGHQDNENEADASAATTESGGVLSAEANTQTSAPEAAAPEEKE
eukprot:GEMP01011543.1.p1 GENE.GEMP01011543.1~~GEMP01011543.1.p1  ORF type:complete len:519 (+),score=110.03 GEMP01011543.1:129-1685(+)